MASRSQLRGWAWMMRTTEINVRRLSCWMLGAHLRMKSMARRRCWDVAFGVGSAVPALLYGVAVGNVLRGLDMDASGVTTTLVGLLNPFALLIGLLGVAMFVLHGATYLGLKTDGALQDRMRHWASAAWVAVDHDAEAIICNVAL